MVWFSQKRSYVGGKKDEYFQPHLQERTVLSYTERQTAVWLLGSFCKAIPRIEKRVQETKPFLD